MRRADEVLSRLPDAVLALDGTGRITLSNRAAEELLQRDPLGLQLVDVIRAPAAHALLPEGEGEFGVPGGRVFFMRATPLANGTLLVLRDHTRLRQLETVRRDFVANVSHELRTPVAVIRANAEALLDGALEEQPMPFIEAMQRNADRLNALVSDLLDLARIDEGGDELALEPQKLRTVGRKLAEEYEGLEVDLPKGRTVVADTSALEQVLVNLVENARKYTEGRVWLRSTQNGAFVRIEVADEGAGIEPHHRERIFERFYRVDAGRSRRLGGTGLGLAIVRNLVLAMHGRVGVEANEPTGSVFWLELPAVAPIDTEDDELRSDAAPAPIRFPERRPSTRAATVEVIRERLLLMAGRVEAMIASAAQAYVERDLELARQTIAQDRAVNEDELRIDEHILTLLGSERPPPKDLRFLAITLKMVTDLERIADLAVSLSDGVIALGGQDRPGPVDPIPEMASTVQEMVRSAIDAFVRDDLDLAREVLRLDQRVDALHRGFDRAVVKAMRKDPKAVRPGVHVAAIARHLERMGDHATNLAEQVVFMIAGRDIRHRG